MPFLSNGLWVPEGGGGVEMRCARCTFRVRSDFRSDAIEQLMRHVTLEHDMDPAKERAADERRVAYAKSDAYGKYGHQRDATARDEGPSGHD